MFPLFQLGVGRSTGPGNCGLICPYVIKQDYLQAREKITDTRAPPFTN